MLPSSSRTCKVASIQMLAGDNPLVSQARVVWMASESPTALQFWRLGSSKRGTCKGPHDQNKGTSHKEDSLLSMTGLHYIEDSKRSDLINRLHHSVEKVK